MTMRQRGVFPKFRKASELCYFILEGLMEERVVCFSQKLLEACTLKRYLNFICDIILNLYILAVIVPLKRD